ncbi:phage major capsid protein [Mycobacterium aquaticum]|nr:phage major capsid protein [Mycobacterium aquaticum]
MNIIELKKQARELGAETGAKLKAFNDGTITTKAFTEYMVYAQNRDKEITEQIKAYNAAAGIMTGPGETPRSQGLRRKGSEVCPIGFDEIQLKAMHDAISHKASYAITTKAFSTVDGLLPAQLAPYVVGPQFESRLLDRLPVELVTAPSLEYIRHTSTTNAPGIVAEGQPKPELIFNTDKVVATAQKIAAHTGISWESLTDWSAFAEYCQVELMREVVNLENAELIAGDGTTGHLTGLLATSGILTHDASGDTGTNVTALDSVEKSIAQLRTGQALAEANLFVVHPNTWSALRRTKDSQGRYLVDPDPTNAAGNQLWGVEVLPTTQITAGVGALLDTNKFGYVVLRESLTVRTGTSDNDFVSNIVRFIAEERLTLAAERPAAVCKITNLPAA